VDRPRQFRALHNHLKVSVDDTSEIGGVVLMSLVGGDFLLPSLCNRFCGFHSASCLSAATNYYSSLGQILDGIPGNMPSI
jgi:hypothetical protein